jgi:hypothetical protein
MELISAFVAAGAGILACALVARRPLLVWYLRELRGLDVPRTPDDEIVTYPLA